MHQRNDAQPFLTNLKFAQLAKKSCSVMELECSLPYLQ
jgi:hypothetical protein